MKFRLLLLVLALAALVVLTSAPVLAHQYGCTPGYWKNHPAAWVGYSPTDSVMAVFGPDDLEFADGSSLPAGLTLMGALSLKGGSTIAGAAGIFLRAAVAKLLNISAGIHDGDEATFKSYIRSGLNYFDRDQLIIDAGIYDDDNNAPYGCPLN